MSKSFRTKHLFCFLHRPCSFAAADARLCRGRAADKATAQHPDWYGSLAIVTDPHEIPRSDMQQQGAPQSVLEQVTMPMLESLCESEFCAGTIPSEHAHLARNGSLLSAEFQNESRPANQSSSFDVVLFPNGMSDPRHKRTMHNIFRSLQYGTTG